MKTHLAWLSSEGASPQLLDELVTAVGPLPVSYLQLLSLGNGGEVELQCAPHNLCLDSAESAISFWRSGSYTKAGIFVFGGDGGGELLAFDISQAGKWPVLCFDPISPNDSARVIASDFEGLLAQVVQAE